jgi:sugar fermentation stimulation protein A
MQFQNPLFEGRLVKRYKRFLADIELVSGELITAHCPNPGSMLGLKDVGARVWVSKVPDDSKRKLIYTWELIESDGQLAGINTQYPNHLVEEVLRAKLIPELAIYTSIRREVKYGTNSRIDFLLEADGVPPCYLEVKNVHLKRQGRAEFPDSVTERGAKHLRELMAMVQQGARAIILYVVQRQDCQSFAIASDIDPAYGAAYQFALLHGVEQLCYQCKMSLTEIVIHQRMVIHSAAR